jgi:hypothetical protein
MSAKRNKPKDPNRYPPGWDAGRVKRLIDYYDRQTEEEAIAEADAAYENRKNTVMLVPTELVWKVRQLIAKHAASAAPRAKSGKRRRPRAA